MHRSVATQLLFFVLLHRELSQSVRCLRADQPVGGRRAGLVNLGTLRAGLVSRMVLFKSV